MKRFPALALLFALLTPSSALAAPATGCTYPGTIDLQLAQDPNTIIYSSVWNEGMSCVNDLQTVLGVNPQGGYATVDARLDAEMVTLAGTGGPPASVPFACATAATCVEVTAGVLNGVLNASEFPGADMGAKVNAAIGECDNRVGVFSQCTVTMASNHYTLTNPIQVDRAFTTLDCGGAELLGSPSFHGPLIRVNVPTIGTLATSSLSTVTVRNCTLNGSSQTDASAFDGASPPGTITDQRSGYVTMYGVLNGTLQNLLIINPPMTGVWVSNSLANVSNITVLGTRTPLSFGGKDSDGITLIGGTLPEGTLKGGISGSNLLVEQSAKLGIRVMDRTTLTGVRVVNSDHTCIGTKLFTNSQGVGDVTLANGGAISIGEFALTGCNVEDADSNADAAAIEINGGGDNVRGINIGNGRITNTNGNGISMASLNNATITGVAIACWADEPTSANADAVRLGSTVVGLTISGSSFAAASSEAGTCDVRSDYVGVNISSPTTLGPIVVSGNSFAGGSEGEDGMYVVGATAQLRLLVSGNVFSQWDLHGVYVLLDDAQILHGLQITGNRFNLIDGWGAVMFDFSSASSAAFLLYPVITGNSFTDNDDFDLVIEPDGGAADDIRGVLVSGNYMESGALISDESGNDTREEIISIGNTFAGGASTALHDQTINWSGVLNYGIPGCFSGASIVACTTGAAAKSIAGISNGDYSGIVTHGVFLGAACEGTINAGDFVGRSGSVNGALAAVGSPGAGEAIGVALTACTASKVNVSVGKL